MALPKASRPPSDERTLQKISNDYKRFTDAGSLLKNAKNCNNVIGKVFFDIPTTFVSKIEYLNQQKTKGFVIFVLFYI